MHSIPKALFASLTILVITCGQLFGIGIGYICECHDAPLITLSSQCHDDPAGPHHESETSGEEHSHTTSSSHSSDSRLPHVPNRDNLEASPLNKLPTAPPPQELPLVWLGEILPPLLHQLPQLGSSQLADFLRRVEVLPINSNAQMITSSTVLLI